MSRAETWVQEYAEPFSPGPDGEPLPTDRDNRDVRELVVQSRPDIHPRSNIEFRTTYRQDRGIMQRWRKVA